MTPRFAVATFLVRAWTRLYTLGVPVDLRDERRAEIESDLWESRQDAEAGGTASPALQIVLRLVRGSSRRFDVVGRAP